jgi:hypothetical protein
MTIRSHSEQLDLVRVTRKKFCFYICVLLNTLAKVLANLCNSESGVNGVS